jgi:hypothetical protein
MKRNEKLHGVTQKSNFSESKKNIRTRLAIVFAILALVGALAYRVVKDQTPSQDVPKSGSISIPEVSSAGQSVATAALEPPKSVPRSTSEATVAALPVSRADSDGPASADASVSTVQTHELIARLSQIDPSSGPLSKEQVKEINRSIKGLIAQGQRAVPAIHEYLQQNQDVNFAELADGNPLDNASLRLGLIDALEKIGGPEALATTVKTLEAAGDPMEIAVLTRSLEKQSPGEYREMELKAAQEALNMASNNQLQGKNVNPLFEVFQNYGDASVVPDLEKAVKGTEWRYQAATALSEMPDGSGIPALVKLAQDPQVSALDQGDVALRALAQVATKYPDAQTALIEQARAGNIPEKAWPAIASALSGTYVFPYAQQVFGSPGSFPGLADPQIPERLGLMDKMLAAASGNPAATASLKEHRAALASRLSIR